MAWYHVSEPSSYLALTGLGIDKVVVKKKAMVLPFQKVTKFSITPFDFSLSLQAMTVEKLNFSLPAVFTIGPDDNEEALIKYAVLLTGNEGDHSTTSTSKKDVIGVAAGRNHVQSIVKGIIEGETRSIVSTMTV
jgi:flotillin